jgi:hypothetical protein
MTDKINKGDRVETPRFCTVRIQKVFRSESNARKQKFIEPTHYENDRYGILGKHVGPNLMIFAAYVKNHPGVS